jgi:hypothetical protein
MLLPYKVGMLRRRRFNLLNKTLSFLNVFDFFFFFLYIELVKFSCRILILRQSFLEYAVRREVFHEEKRQLVFGQPLASILAREGGTVPQIVIRCVEFLSVHGTFSGVDSFPFLSFFLCV